jgi:hypothetical protein
MRQRSGAGAGPDAEHPRTDRRRRLISAAGPAMGRRALLLVIAAIAVALSPARPAEADRKAAEARALLERLNQRWTGADARMRVSVELTGGTDRDGWSDSRWMMHEAVNDSDQRFFLKMQVTNRRTLGHLIADDHLVAGARLRSLGWRFEQPDEAKGLYLELEFADAPARMRWRFTRRGFSMKAKIEADELVHIERYMRLDAFELRSATEQLVAVAPTVAPTPVPRPPTPTPTPVVLPPEIGAIHAEVRPTHLRPGSEVRLVITYTVSGLRPGETLEVTELRRLAAGDDEIERFEHRLRRPAGAVTSELPVQVPYGTPPGVYSVGATIRAAGLPAASDTAFFVVTTAGGAP